MDDAVDELDYASAEATAVATEVSLDVEDAAGGASRDDALLVFDPDGGA